MEGFYKVPAKVMEELMDYYRNELTDNTQLTRAAKLAAQKNLWLASGYPASVINANIKPLSRELGHLTKRIREVGEDEGEPAVKPPTIKASPKTPKVSKKKPKPSTRRRLLPTRPDETNPKPKKRKRQTEVEKLQPRPGWEEWGAGRKLRRQLEYDDD